MKRCFTVLGMSLLLLALAACGVVPKPAEQQIYVLQAQAAPPQADSPGSRVLMIAQVRAEAGYDTRQIAYSDVPFTLNYYSRSEWADEPARLITPLLATVIAQTSAYRAVLTQPTPVLADRRLDVELLRLQQDFLTQPSQLQLSLRASLSDAGSNSLIASRLFEVSEPAPSEDAYGGVQAANQALSKVLGELAAWLLTQEGS